jgi:ubiquitin-protein ligase
MSKIGKEAADLLEHENITYNPNTYTLKIKSKTSNYTLKLTFKGKKLNFSLINDKLENIHLYNILISKGMDGLSYNKLDDFKNFINTEIDKLTNYCVGCYKSIDFQSDEFITCGSKECDYKYEELQFGNPVIEKVRDDPDLARFLIYSGIDAIKSNRKMDIFEPFPRHFLNGDINIERGEISKLTGKNYDELKDFNKLNQVIDSLDLEKLLDIIDVSADDTELLKMIGIDTYTFIRFILTSIKVNMVVDNELVKNTSCKIYRVDHNMDKTDEFNNNKNNQESMYLFHGSNWQNWYSILRNGLKNCSKTKLMTAGAAYGNGIYLSDDINLSYRYGNSNRNSSGKWKVSSVIGVFEVIDGKNYKKANTVFVVPDEQKLIQRYLIIFKNNTMKDLSNINTVFNTNIYKEKEDKKMVVMTKGIKKLVREYKRIAKQDSQKLGFQVKVANDSFYKWSVFIDKFDEEYPIGKDMIELGIKCIELEILFPENYPYAPPFIRIISPRFKYQTGHVTQAGALCMEILTPKGWSPACSVESVIVTIKSEIIEGEGRVDKDKYKIPYNLEESKSSFVRVARSHRWL